MKIEDLVRGLAYLGMAYGKEYTEIECEQHYDFLREYSYETFVAAIKSIIKKSKFLPKITELLEECENHKEQSRFEILEFMKKQEYFKNPNEYEKAQTWLERNIVPQWFKNDMNEYYRMLKQEKISYQETKLIG